MFYSTTTEDTRTLLQHAEQYSDQNNDELHETSPLASRIEEECPHCAFLQRDFTVWGNDLSNPAMLTVSEKEVEFN